MEIGKHWKTIQMIFQESRGSSMHYAVATVNEDGSPHVTPMGALFLFGNKTGFCFDEFPVNMSRNLERNPRVCILAVNSNPTFWQKSLLAGKFETPPAVRLMGPVGKKREQQKKKSPCGKIMSNSHAGRKGMISCGKICEGSGTSIFILLSLF
jgi:hypothetical protein